jgi:hypothetical protein
MRFLQSIFCLPFLPRSVGATRSEGGCSQAKRASFSEDPNQIVCVRFQKAKPAIWGWKPKPAGLELVSDGAERRNYPEAKPKREGQERQTCV